VTYNYKLINVRLILALRMVFVNFLIRDFRGIREVRDITNTIKLKDF